MANQVLDSGVLASIREIGASRNKPNYLRELFHLFDEHAQKLLLDAHQAIESQDMQKLRYIGHTLKGSARSVGAVRLAECCLELQGLAELPRLNVDLVWEVYDETKASFQQVRAKLKREI